MSGEGREPQKTTSEAVCSLRGLFLGHRLVDDPHDVGLLHDEELLAVDLDFGPGPFAKQQAVADLDLDGDELARLVAATGANGDDSPWEGFSLAVSGMMMPPADFSSASMRLTTTRS